MFKLSIDVKEAKKLLANADKETKDAVNNAMVQVGFFMEGKVKDSISGREAEPRSVDTGKFMGSVNHEENGEMQTVIKSDVEYAGSLEYGTSKRDGRHHFRNSVERNREKINKFIIDKLK